MKGMPMTKTDELKAALIKLLFDQNGMANSIELVEALEVWIDAKIEARTSWRDPDYEYDKMGDEG